MKIEFPYMDFMVRAFIVKTAAGQYEHDQSQQKQDAARRRKLFKYRPEKFLGDMHAAAAPGKAFRRFRFHVTGVQAITGAGFRFKLRPKLADLETFGDAPPEIVQPGGK